MNRRPREASAALGAGLFTLLSLLGGCAAAPSVGDAPSRLISVRGVGRVAVKPDLAVVRVGSEMRAPTLTDATAEVARRQSAVLSRLKSLGVAERDITTVVYSVDPVAAPRRTEEDPSRIVAYHVVNVVQVKIRDLTAAGRILDGALGAGANTISALQFTLDDPRPVEAEARALAVKAAAATAQQLAAAAGVRLGEVVSVTEGPAVRPPVERMMMRSAAAPAMSAGPVESGQYDVVVSVEAHYRIH
ncbi:MAG: SIMPL domain-containing protein [Candidatus Rokuibacteriota bacterium]